MLSIPIDIWALGLCARTLFLERLKVEPQPGLGLALWWKWALFNVIYLPILYIVVGAAASGAHGVTVKVLEFVKEHVWEIPLAEQISIELVMWGSMASVVLILLILGWLYGLGALVQRHVREAVPQEGSYQDLIYRWDLLRVPTDQPLLLTAFTGAGVVLVFVFWGLLPATTPHPHEEYEYTNIIKVEPPVKPLEVLKNTENVLARADLTVKEIEKKKEEESTPGKSKDKDKDKEPNKEKSVPAQPEKK